MLIISVKLHMSIDEYEYCYQKQLQPLQQLNYIGSKKLKHKIKNYIFQRKFFI